MRTRHVKKLPLLRSSNEGRMRNYRHGTPLERRTKSAQPRAAVPQDQEQVPPLERRTKSAQPRAAVPQDQEQVPPLERRTKSAQPRAAVPQDQERVPPLERRTKSAQPRAAVARSRSGLSDKTAPKARKVKRVAQRLALGRRVVQSRVPEGREPWDIPIHPTSSI